MAAFRFKSYAERGTAAAIGGGGMGRAAFANEFETDDVDDDKECDCRMCRTPSESFDTN